MPENLLSLARIFRLVTDHTTMKTSRCLHVPGAHRESTDHRDFFGPLETYYPTLVSVASRPACRDQGYSCMEARTERESAKSARDPGPNPNRSPRHTHGTP